MRQKGDSLLELLVVIAIIVVVVVIFSQVFATFRQSGQLAEIQSQLIGMIRNARAKTLASVDNSNYGMHFEETKAVLFKGDQYSASDPENDVYEIHPSFRLVLNMSGQSDVIFARLTGYASASGSIVIESRTTTSRNRTITILSTGNVK